MAQGFILNVDDHAPARVVRTRILERAGFGVQEGDRGTDAIEGAPQAALLLLGISLADGDGFSVCEQLKKQRPALPILMVASNNRSEQVLRDAYAAGADACLLEPLEAEQLVRTVRELATAPGGCVACAADPWVITDAAGHILEVSPAGARLLNLSVRGARGRSLPAFFTENRPRLLNDLLRVTAGTPIERTTMLQPRDRRARTVRLDLSLIPTSPGERVQVRWVIGQGAD